MIITRNTRKEIYKCNKMNKIISAFSFKSARGEVYCTYYNIYLTLKHLYYILHFKVVLISHLLLFLQRSATSSQRYLTSHNQWCYYYPKLINSLKFKYAR